MIFGINGLVREALAAEKAEERFTAYADWKPT
jgi:hypothetical protein